MTIPQAVIERGPKAVGIFKESMRIDGSERFAEMLALQAPPGCMTDSVFTEGIGTLDKQIRDKFALKKLIAAAKRQGYTPNPHDFYNPALARRLGDPLAFIPPGGGRGHVKRVLESQGKGTMDGSAVKVDAVEPLSDPHEKRVHKLHPRIVNRRMRQMLKENPGLAAKPRRELAEQIIDKHGAR